MSNTFLLNSKLNLADNNSIKVKTPNNDINNIINDKKELNIGAKDKISINLDNLQKKDDANNIINDYYNEILSKKESRLLGNSNYVTLENKIGENSCFVNVIIHFLYIFPCVNDYLIKKYKEKKEKKRKQTKHTKKKCYKII